MSTPADPNFVPGYAQAGVVSGRTGKDSMGDSRPSDPTNQPNQYPDSLFGMPLPSGTGAPGSQGAGGAADPTNQPGQLEEGITGMGPPQTTHTGSPGSQGAKPSLGAGPDTVTFTKLSSGIGPYQTQTVSDEISGSGDWTAANDQGYASGGPQLPGIRGNEPSVNEGPFTAKSGGRVLRGGRGAS
jgi:hypothetical protein